MNKIVDEDSKAPEGLSVVLAMNRRLRFSFGDRWPRCKRCCDVEFGV